MPDPSLRIAQQFSPFGTATDQSPMLSPLDPNVQQSVVNDAVSTVQNLPVDQNSTYARYAQWLSDQGLLTQTAVNDGNPPGVPSTPTVTATLGGIKVIWDGLDANKQVMPADFARVEVHTSTTAGFTPSPTTLATIFASPAGGSAILVTGYTVTYIVFVAYDTFGNQSGQSAQASGQGVQVTGPDLQANSVTTNAIAAGAVTATQIAAGAITADKIGTGTLTVGTKITLGSTLNGTSRVEIDTQAAGGYGPGIRLISRDSGGVDAYQVVLDTSNGLGTIYSGNMYSANIIGAVVATANTGARVELGSSPTGTRSGSWGTGAAGATGSLGVFNGSEDANHPLVLSSLNLPASNSIRGIINSPSLGTSTSAGFSQILLQGALSTAPSTGKGVIGVNADHVYVRGPVLDGSSAAAVSGWEVYATDNLAIVNQSVTTDASGNFTVTHGLGWTPITVLIFARYTGGFASVTFGSGSYTGTTFAGRMSGASTIQTSAPITWIAYRVL